MLGELLMLAALVQTREVPKNPTEVIFTCADHDRDDQHELDIIRSSDGTVLQTILLGDPPADAAGLITAAINVQPIAFGTYTAVARAVAGGVKSENSDPSNAWERVPGKPGTVRVQ
jgi:hypothetical protein